MSVLLSVSNQSSKPDADVQAAMAAIQIQIDRDFLPMWLGTTPAGVLKFTGKDVPTDGSWPVVILDKPTEPDACGFHEVLKNSPFGFVFIEPDPEGWVGTFSHEVLEVLGDPWASTCIIRGKKSVGLEVCDAVEDDSFCYPINGLNVSNFVGPRYFNLVSTGPFDYGRKVTKPFQVLKGGYLPVQQFHKSAWEVKLHSGKTMLRQLIPVGSRRWKRMVAFHQAAVR